MNRPWCALAVVVGAVVVWGARMPAAESVAVQGADRRERREPGLILHARGRTAACDVVRFTSDGRSLVATGDDKVVSQWRLDESGRLDPESWEALRWPIWREQRGAIYALALSNDPAGQMAAIGGVGVKTGMVAVLDRFNGRMKHVLNELSTGQNSAVWAIAFNQANDVVVYGCDDGQIWWWPLAERRARKVGRVGVPGHTRVRLVHFEGDRLWTLAQDGQLVRWTKAGSDAPESKVVLKVALARVLMAQVSPDGQLLAVIGEGTADDATNVRHVLLYRLGDTPALAHQWLVPHGQYPHCLAWSADSRRLAVGTRVIPQDQSFYVEGGGEFRLYDVTQPNLEPVVSPRQMSRVERLAFHPSGKLLAVAGSDDNEITLWKLSPELAPGDVVRSVGSALWQVTLSSDGRHVGWRDAKNLQPPHPNERAKPTPWRTFDLQERKMVSTQPGKPLRPITEQDGWTVLPDRVNAWQWYVVGPEKQQLPLPWNPALNDLPRCYSFLPKREGQPPRLAVGHYWGVSVFGLYPDRVELQRLYVGHQGEVTSLIVSADGKTMVTASRDQTLAGWSLLDWPDAPELGVRFVLRADRLEVAAAAPGSPGWEAGLQPGDQVEFFAHAGKAVTGGPEAWMKILRRPPPGLECYFRVRRAGQEEPIEMLTTVRQRPLWRFFPTRDGEWVLWRWRDYYYDCSTNGDFYIGWHVDGEADESPSFYRAEQFRFRYHRPAKVAELLTATTNVPEKARFPDLEPPTVTLRLEDRTAVVREGNIRVNLTAAARTPRENQRIDRVQLWVNDYLYATRTVSDLALDQGFTIPADKLRRGGNVLVAQAFNREGGRGESAGVRIEVPRAAEPARLFGLFVGVGDYRQAFPPQKDLSAHVDAQALLELWQHQKGKLYPETHLASLLNEAATPEAILAKLRQLAQEVKPDDRLVLSLAGHGVSGDVLNNLVVKHQVDVVDRLAPGSFAFLGPKFDLRRPNNTAITGEDLYKAIAALPCRKLILLDACHSGSIHASPVRELARDGIGPVILAASEPHQAALEYADLDDQRRANGLFTLAVIRALTEDFDLADRNRDGNVDTDELARYVRQRVRAYVDQLRKEGIAKETDDQTPVAFPAYQVETIPVAGR